MKTDSSVKKRPLPSSRRRWAPVILAGLIALGLAGPQGLAGERMDRINFHQQELFVSGGNVAWIHFARDIGANRTEVGVFEEIFREVAENGGNVLRFWLHTNGRHTPAWKGQTVVGPGDGAIADLRAILDAAHRQNVALMLCLWSFDMLRLTNGPRLVERARAILTQPENRQSYLDHALIPMVEAVRGHPGLFAWEIFNEPEGMSHEFGWSHVGRVSMAEIQQFVNLAAGAIRRSDPHVLITNGAWSFMSLTDRLDQRKTANYYSDPRLIEAGGDPLGTLDFYTVHYYSWAGPSLSPFRHDASHWALDKPIVVAEFYAKEDLDGISRYNLYTTLHDRGYAGALGWQWVDHAQNRDNNKQSWPIILQNINTLNALHPEAVRLPAPKRADPPP